MLHGRSFYVKRDDLIDPYLGGNKYRKLFELLRTPSERYDRLVSYGGAQSNAMLAMAALARRKGWSFDYYVKTLPEWLKHAPTGNLAHALSLGMRLYEVPHECFDETIEKVREKMEVKRCFVSQGGADARAAEGVRRLAKEIEIWQKRRAFDRLVVATPSGTGTTAWFLRGALPEEVEVVTTPVVGDREILKRQLLRLHPSGMATAPRILDRWGKWPFAKPRKAYLEIWDKLRRAGILFDLIYAPRMWLEILEAVDDFDAPVLYVHSGGVSGNETQLARYRHLGM